MLTPKMTQKATLIVFYSAKRISKQVFWRIFFPDFCANEMKCEIAKSWVIVTLQKDIKIID